MKQKDGVTALYVAASNGYVDVVKVLVSIGANVNTLNSVDGSFPLYGAAYFGRLDCVKYLLSAGANPVLTWKNTTSTQAAETAGHKEVVTYLKQFIQNQK